MVLWGGKGPIYGESWYIKKYWSSWGRWCLEVLRERERVCVCNAANSKIIVGSMKPSLVGQKLVRKDLIMS